MPGADPVRFYFDFISPYSYLACALLAREPAYQAIPLSVRPVSFGTMLSRRGVKGPGEDPVRRRLGLEDVLLLASLYDVPLRGPPAHPFNSVYALRSVCAVPDEAAKRRLATLYFRAAWAEGRALDDLGVLRACLDEAGIAQDPEEAASARENRQALRDSTDEVLALGAWGVPTFAAGGLLFYGHDRLPLLRAFLDGRARLDRSALDDLLARPQPGRIV